MSNRKRTTLSGPGPGQKPSPTMAARLNRAMDTPTPRHMEKTLPAPLRGGPILPLSFAIPSVEREEPPSARRQTRSSSPAKRPPPSYDQADDNNPLPRKRASHRRHKTAEVANKIQADFGDFAHLILEPLEQRRAEDNAIHERNLGKLVDRIDTSHEAILATTKVGLAHFRATTKRNFEHMGEVLSVNSQDLFQSVDANALRRHDATTSSLDAVSQSVKHNQEAMRLLNDTLTTTFANANTQHGVLDVKVNNIVNTLGITTNTLGTMAQNNTARDTTLRNRLHEVQGEVAAAATRTQTAVNEDIARLNRDLERRLHEVQGEVTAAATRTQTAMNGDLERELQRVQGEVTAAATRTENTVNGNIAQLNRDLERRLQRVQDDVADAATRTQRAVNEDLERLLQQVQGEVAQTHGAVTAGIDGLSNNARSLVQSLQSVQNQVTNAAAANQQEIKTVINSQVEDIRKLMQDLIAASDQIGHQQGRAEQKMDDSHKHLEQQIKTTKEFMVEMRDQLIERNARGSAASDTLDPRSHATDIVSPSWEHQFDEIRTQLANLQRHLDANMFPQEFTDIMMEVREYIKHGRQPQPITSDDNTQMITQAHAAETTQLQDQLAKERETRREVEQAAEIAIATAHLQLDMAKTSHDALSERNSTMRTEIEDAQRHAHLFGSEFEKFTHALTDASAITQEFTTSQVQADRDNVENQNRELARVLEIEQERARAISMTSSIQDKLPPRDYRKGFTKIPHSTTTETQDGDNSLAETALAMGEWEHEAKDEMGQSSGLGEERDAGGGS